MTKLNTVMSRVSSGTGKKYEIVWVLPNGKTGARISGCQGVRTKGEAEVFVEAFNIAIGYARRQEDPLGPAMREVFHALGQECK